MNVSPKNNKQINSTKKKKNSKYAQAYTIFISCHIVQKDGKNNEFIFFSNEKVV